MSDLYEPTWQAGLADEALHSISARRGTPDDADPEDEGTLDEIGDDLDDEFDDVDDLEDEEDDEDDLDDGEDFDAAQDVLDDDDEDLDADDESYDDDES